MNIIFLSHCNFLGNSAMHVFAIANELVDLGHDCWVLVPDSPETVAQHGLARFKVHTYAEAMTCDSPFKDGRAPDLIHAWTPREHVREATENLVGRFAVPYFVHMEDHEEQIIADENPLLSIEEIKRLPDSTQQAIISSYYRSHPLRAKEFISEAIGYTCLIENLKEFASDGQRTLTFWPGFDHNFKNDPQNSEETRSQLGITPDATVILYSGNTHTSIAQDVSDLYTAVGLLNRQGRKIRLIRTGWDHADIGYSKEARKDIGVIELGFVPREILPSLTYSADILVQPGKVNAFNDYRFPSKLPEFLVSGRPVILPNSNIGVHLTNNLNAIKLNDSNPEEIASKIGHLIDSPCERINIGKAGRKFALENLTWKSSALKLVDFYESTLENYNTYDNNKIDSTQLINRFPVDLIAFYLPQFHSIAENDEWWGKGFTEWTNVVRAPQNFVGHDQPRLPTDLGYYDLRLVQNMHSQANLARRYGVTGFCFYYYWFDGRRLLETPIDNWMSSGPQFPFCICWANEPWSRRWDGSNAEMLLDQPYSEGFEEKFFLDILPILKDPRYIRVDGAPLLMIYKIIDLPDPISTVAKWRALARDNGIDKLHIVATQSFGITDPRPYGLDAAVEFSPPHVDRQLVDPQRMPTITPRFTGYLEDYIGVALKSINATPTDYVRYRGLFPRWDNSARRKNAGHILINDTAKAYGYWLRHLTHEALVRRDQQRPLIFVNAWNEWAEGTYLEPDETYGLGLLEVTKEALSAGTVDFIKGNSNRFDINFINDVSLIPNYKQNT